jgi:hypothetical protein
VPFSTQHADIACNFFEEILKHTQDQWAGLPFMLAPWEEDAIREIFGLSRYSPPRIASSSEAIRIPFTPQSPPMAISPMASILLP